MSAFGSSVINKSSKRLAPKAPARRRAPTTPLPASNLLTSSNDPSNAVDYLPGSAQVLGSQPGSTNVEDEAPAGLRVQDEDRTGQDKATEVEATDSEPSGTKERPRKRRRLQEAGDVVETETNTNAQSELSRTQSVEHVPTPSTAKKGTRARKGAAPPAAAIINGSTAEIQSTLESVPLGKRTRKRDETTAETEQFHNESEPHQLPSRSKNDAANDRDGERRSRTSKASKKNHAEKASIVQSEMAREGPKGKKSAGKRSQGPNLAANRKQQEPAITEDEVVHNSKKSSDQRPRQTRSRASRKAATESVVEELTDIAADEVEETNQANEEQRLDAAAEDVTADSVQRENQPPRKSKDRKRAATPEDAANHIIDAEAVFMSDLTKNSKLGKKSKLETEFQDIDWGEVVRRRKAAEEKARGGQRNPGQEANAQVAQADEQRRAAAPTGPRLKLVNGEMVVDTSSLVVDRHAAARPDEAQPAVEEQDITRRVNSRSWLFDNRKDVEERYRSSNKADPWSAEDTVLFYGALAMFGTDFNMISKMFPGRTRRHIKTKFVREERADPESVKRALIGQRKPMTLEDYCEATGQKPEVYKDPELLDEELRVEEENQKLEIERQKEEQAEAARKKQEAAAAKAEAGRQRKKVGEKKSRKKKPKQTGGLSRSEPVEESHPATEQGVIESIEVDN